MLRWWLIGITLTALMTLAAWALIRFVPRRVPTDVPPTPQQLMANSLGLGAWVLMMPLQKAGGAAETLGLFMSVAWLLFLAWHLRREHPWQAALLFVGACGLGALGLTFPPKPMTWWGPYALAGSGLGFVVVAYLAWVLGNERRFPRPAATIPADH